MSELAKLRAERDRLLSVVKDEVDWRLRQVYSPEGVELWWQSENPLLSNATPQQAWAGSRWEEVLQLVSQLMDGAYV